MHLAVTLKVTGGLLMLFSGTLLIPAVVAWLYGEATIGVFTTAFLITLVVGVVLWVIGPRDMELRSRDGFLITVLFYIGLGMFRGPAPLSRTRCCRQLDGRGVRVALGPHHDRCDGTDGAR